MPRPLKRGILGASTIILSKDIDEYAFMCGSNFYEPDVSSQNSTTAVTLKRFKWSFKNYVCKRRGVGGSPKMLTFCQRL